MEDETYYEPTPLIESLVNATNDETMSDERKLDKLQDLIYANIDKVKGKEESILGLVQGYIRMPPETFNPSLALDHINNLLS